MDADDVRSILLDWSTSDEFVCRTCADTARINPADRREWGCLSCGLRTYSPAIYFRYREDGHDGTQ